MARFAVVVAALVAAVAGAAGAGKSVCGTLDKDGCGKDATCTWNPAMFTGCGPRADGLVRVAAAELFCSELRYEVDLLRMWNWFIKPISVGMTGALWQPAVALEGMGTPDLPPALAKKAAAGAGLVANVLRTAPKKVTAEVFQSAVFPNFVPLMKLQATLLVATAAAVTPKLLDADASAADLPVPVTTLSAVKAWTRTDGNCVPYVSSVGLKQLPEPEDVRAAVIAAARATATMMEDARWQSRMAAVIKGYASWGAAGLPLALTKWSAYDAEATKASDAAGFGLSGMRELFAAPMQRTARYPLLLKAALDAFEKRGAPSDDIDTLRTLLERCVAAAKKVDEALQAPSSSSSSSSSSALSSTKEVVKASDDKKPSPSPSPAMDQSPTGPLSAPPPSVSAE